MNSKALHSTILDPDSSVEPAHTDRAAKEEKSEKELAHTKTLHSILDSARNQLDITGLARTLLGYMLRNPESIFSPEMFTHGDARGVLGEVSDRMIADHFELLRLRFLRTHGLPLTLEFQREEISPGRNHIRSVIVKFHPGYEKWTPAKGEALKKSRDGERKKITSNLAAREANLGGETGKQRKTDQTSIIRERAALNRRLQDAARIAGCGSADFDDTGGDDL